MVGLKPTYGLVSRYGLIAFGSSLDTVGPVGRCVEDVARVLGVIAGRKRDGVGLRVGGLLVNAGVEGTDGNGGYCWEGKNSGDRADSGGLRNAVQSTMCEWLRHCSAGWQLWGSGGASGRGGVVPDVGWCGVALLDSGMSEEAGAVMIW